MYITISGIYIGDFFSKKYFIKTTSKLIMYLLVLTFSVLFSFTFWYEKFSAEDYAKRNSAFQLNGVKKILIDTKNSFHSIVNSLNNLAEYSNKKAFEEEKVKDTCGKKTPRTYGSFTQIRLDDKEIANLYVEDLQKLENDLSLDISRIENYIESYKPKSDIKEFSKKVNNDILRINSKYLNNAILTNIVNTLKIRSGDNRKKISVTNREKQTTSIKSCEDKVFTSKVNNVITNIEKLKKINELKFVDVNNIHTSILNSHFLFFIIPFYQINKITLR